MDDGGSGGRPIRNQWIELLRLVAAFGIVWYHSGVAGAPVAYAGLTAFLVVSLLFECARSPDRPMDVTGLAARLGIPWLFWTCAYAALNTARHKPPLEPAPSPLAAILYGAKPHLWYLPFIFVALLAVRAVRRSPGRDLLAPLALAAGLAMLAALPIWRPWSLAEGPPTGQYAQALPAALFGIVLAAAVRRPPYRIGVALLLLGMLGDAVLPFSGTGVPFVIGCGAVTGALLMQRFRPLQQDWPARWATLTFGVYLVHPLLLFAVQPVLRGNGPAGVALAFLLSLFIVWALRRWGGRPGRAVT